MFEKSKFIYIWAVRNRVYTGETHVDGFKNLNFVLFHAPSGLCLCSSDSTAWRKPYYIRRKVLKHPLRFRKQEIPQIQRIIKSVIKNKPPCQFLDNDSLFFLASPDS